MFYCACARFSFEFVYIFLNTFALASTKAFNTADKWYLRYL